jgi:hypothetical protein
MLVSSSSNAVDMLLIGSYEYSAITPEFRQIVHLIVPGEATAPRCRGLSRNLRTREFAGSEGPRPSRG